MVRSNLSKILIQMNRSIILILAFFAIRTVIFAQSYSDSFDIALTSIYDDSELPGFSISIVDTSGLIFSKGYGYANIEKKIPYKPNNTQWIGSISKLFVAVSIMRSIEDGLLSFETPINDILPFEVKNPNFPNDTIKIKHLVNHSAGLPDKGDSWKIEGYLAEEIDFSKYNFAPEEKMWLEAIAKSQKMELSEFLRGSLTPEGNWYTESAFQDYKAGEKSSYSNLGSSLAAFIVEIVQKQPITKYVEQNIFQPLNMSSTGWLHETPYPDLSVVAYSYHNYPFPKVKSNTTNSDIESSVIDLSKFVIDMMLGLEGKGRLMSKESYQDMMEPNIASDDPTDSVGVFWVTQIYIKDKMHTGSGAEITSALGFNPKEKIGYVLLCNSGTHTEELSEAYVKIWRKIIHYRKLLTKDNMH